MRKWGYVKGKVVEMGGREWSFEGELCPESPDGNLADSGSGCGGSWLEPGPALCLSCCQMYSGSFSPGCLDSRGPATSSVLLEES